MTDHRTDPPVSADEVDTLRGFLDFHRATLEWKCAGLDAAGLATTVGPSPMTLGGLLKHLAHVEDKWFGHRLHGEELQPPFDAVDWSADPDWAWHSAAHDTPDELRRLWRRSVERSRTLVAGALEDGGPDRLAARPLPDGQVPSLRWILVHLVEEYAQHNGHAALIRESIDGRTGY